MERKNVILTTTEGEKVEFEVKEEKWYKKAYNKVKTSVSNTVTTVTKTVVDHPIATAMVVGSLIKLADAGVNSYCKIKKVNNPVDTGLTNGPKKTVYDRSNDVWYTLRRPMTNSENYEFSSRRREGEDVGEILYSMNLI